MKDTLHICFFGTYRSNYSRNRMMIEGLRCNGVSVIECHENLWNGVEDRVQITSGGWLNPKFWFRVIRTYSKLLNQYSKIHDFDIMMVGYPGHFDVYLARLLCWIRRKPLVWDVFMSIYLIATERGLDQRSQTTTKLINKAEGLALRLPKLLIQDTQDYVDWFNQQYGIPKDKFRLVPTGVDDRVFHPFLQSKPGDDIFRVIYYGTYIPNHGIEYIIDAARILATENSVRFELVGDGPEKSKAVEIANANHLDNIKFIDWLDLDTLTQRISKAEVCLGSFGSTPQALMTIHNKVYQGMAMQKAVITGDSDAIRAVFEHKENIFIVSRMDSNALADGILELRNNPKLLKHIQLSGYRSIVSNYTLEHTGRRTRRIIETLIN